MRPSARTVALRDQILAALRAEWPLPISTRRVCELLGAHRYDETGYRVYPQLCALDRLGVVERIRRDADCRDVFWRFLGEPTDAELNAAVDAVESLQRQPASPPGRIGGLDLVAESNLPTLDRYIRALDRAEKRFVDAAASGDHDKETADDLAAVVRQFVAFCNEWRVSGEREQ